MKKILSMMFMFFSTITMFSCSANDSGLEYSLNDDGTYSVIGIGNVSSNEITIPSEHDGKPVTTIGENAFSGCSNIKSVTFPNSIETIEIKAFNGCSGLTSVTLPDNLNKIGSEAFGGCSGLTYIIIPESVNLLGGYAFFECTSLTVYCETSSYKMSWSPEWMDNNTSRPVYWGVTEEDIIEQDGIQYLIKDGNAVITRYVGSASEVVIPETIVDNDQTYNVTDIRERAFSYYSKLTNITIPSSIDEIRYDAFGFCTGLRDVLIPSSVTTLKEYAFSNCNDITFYCEATSRPKGWDSRWNAFNRPVYWYSENEPSDEGQYWHYDDNHNIVVW